MSTLTAKRTKSTKAKRRPAEAGAKANGNGVFERPLKRLLVSTGAVTAYALTGHVQETVWYMGYELEGPGFAYTQEASNRHRGYTTRRLAELAAADAVDQRLSKIATPSAKAARKALQKTRALIGAEGVPTSGKAAVEQRSAERRDQKSKPAQRDRAKKISVPLPASINAEATIEIAFGNGGWRADFAIRLPTSRRFANLENQLPYSDEPLAVLAALSRLDAHLVDQLQLHKTKTAIQTIDRIRKAVGSFRAESANEIVDGQRSIDVTSQPAEAVEALEPLSVKEAGRLHALDGVIRTAAAVFLDAARAFREVRDSRLYRESHASIEAWAWERHQIERSVLFRLIKFADLSDQTSAIADKLHLRLTNEAQFRAIEKYSDAGDLRAILTRAARKIEADAAGVKVPTAKILAEAAREEFTAPEDLKRSRRAGSGQGSEDGDRTPEVGHREELPLVSNNGFNPRTRPTVSAPAMEGTGASDGENFPRTIRRLRQFVAEIQERFCPLRAGLGGEGDPVGTIGDAVRGSFLAGALKAMSRETLAIRACRVCGCSEDDPCLREGRPCSWVGADLCSACADKARFLGDDEPFARKAK